LASKKICEQIKIWHFCTFRKLRRRRQTEKSKERKKKFYTSFEEHFLISEILHETTNFVTHILIKVRIHTFLYISFYTEILFWLPATLKNIINLNVYFLLCVYSVNKKKMPICCRMKFKIILWRKWILKIAMCETHTHSAADWFNMVDSVNKKHFFVRPIVECINVKKCAASSWVLIRPRKDRLEKHASPRGMRSVNADSFSFPSDSRFIFMNGWRS
jgi:hypothetical protein